MKVSGFKAELELALEQHGDGEIALLIDGFNVDCCGITHFVDTDTQEIVVEIRQY